MISLFSVEFTSCLLPIKFVGEPLCVSESLGHRKLLSKGYRESPLIFLASQYWKTFVGNTFNLPEHFEYRNFLCMRTENLVLQSKSFVSQYLKKSWEPLLSFGKFGISETFMRITVFLRFFLSHSTEKLREQPSNVSKSFKCEVTKKIFEWERNIIIFRRTFFGSECRKISLWNTSVCQKSSTIEKFHA